MAFLGFEYPRQYPSKVMDILSRGWVGVAFLSFQLKYSSIQDRTFSSCFSWKLGWKTFYKSCVSRNAAAGMCYSMWCLTDTEDQSSRDTGCSTEQMSMRTIPWHPRWAVPLVYQWIILSSLENTTVLRSNAFYKNIDYTILVEEKRCMPTFTIFVCGYS